MPWPERSLVSIRQNFVLRALSGETPIAELCREFGVSRKTGYKWLKRFKEKGVSGLVNRPRRPLRNRLAVTADVVARIVAHKHKHPRWGAKKIWVLLARELRSEDLPFGLDNQPRPPPLRPRQETSSVPAHGTRVASASNAGGRGTERLVDGGLQGMVASR